MGLFSQEEDFDPIKGMEESVKRLERCAEAMKNDDGWRIAFVYNGPKRRIYPKSGEDYFDSLKKAEIAQEAFGPDVEIERMPYDDRRWCMVNAGDGRGAQRMLVDTMFPSEEFAIAHGYQNYKSIGRVNMYTDVLGYFSSENMFSEPKLTDDEFEAAEREWLLRCVQDDKNIIAATRHKADVGAAKARKDLNDLKGWRL